MNRTEAILKLDEAIRDKIFHHSTRSEYETLCDTSKGREEFEKLLNWAREHDQNRRERKAQRAAKAASRGKGAV